MIIKKRHQNIENKENSKENSQIVEPKKSLEAIKEETIQNFKEADITNIEFKERVERRRGDRRRGYRRIDERSLVSRAQEEAHYIKEKAVKDGYQKGLENSISDINELNTSLKQFLGAKDEVYDYVSKDILELALATAKKIIKKEVELSNDVLRGILKEVLEQISFDEQKITLKVAPEDLDIANDEIEKILSNRQFEVKISVLPDENVQKGSCTLIASNGVIDANFSTQLQIIQKALGIYKNTKEEV